MTVPETEAGDGDPYAPATDGRPPADDTASWWPLVTALGAVGFVLGVAVYVVGPDVDAIGDPGLGVAVSLAGLLVAATGVAGWIYQAYVAGYGEKSAEPNEDRYLWGTVLYLPVELALVAAGVLYFARVYFVAWPPGELPPVFTSLTWIMTGILLVSSFTNYFATRALRNGNRRRFLVLLATTPILGALFLAGKAANFSRLVFEEGYGIGSGLYWTGFFSVSGFHGVLVAVGIAFMLVVLVRALAGHYSPESHVSVTTAAWYWWIVDSIWLVLVVEFYATAFMCRAAGNC